MHDLVYGATPTVQVNGGQNEIWRVPFTGIYSEGLELSSVAKYWWSWWIEANTFRSEIPFRNFGLPFKKSRFPREISIREEKIVFIYITSETSRILGGV